jgi:peptidoglycan hydrolase-like protein with peptidoglycan-binding domain
MKSFRLQLIGISLVTALIIPTLSLAQSIVPQASVQASSAVSLTAELQQLEAELASIKAGTSATAPSSVSASAMSSGSMASCPTITAALQFGSTGASVTSLQQFLIAKGLLASASATGYFGVLTQAAVGKWQASQGIATSGSSGYGTVGPKTRAAISAQCSVGSAAGTSANSNSSRNGVPPPPGFGVAAPTGLSGLPGSTSTASQSAAAH